MGFDGWFPSERDDCVVWIEDDGRVGYAYVLDRQDKIRGDVWLYNRGPAPHNFEETDKTAAPRNPAPYVDGATPFTPPNSIRDFAVDWMQDGGTLFARVFIRDKLAAILASGATPGWSALAAKDGPVAKVLLTQSASADAAQTASPAASAGSTSVVELSLTLDRALQEIADYLGGAKAGDADIRLLREKLPAALVPDWLADMLKRYDLAGAHFELTEEQDPSQLGASISWMPAAEMIVEATECEPGMTVVRAGFLPFGTCSVGSGDPYFLDMRQGARDPAVVRVPHDYAGGQSYPIAQIELVARRLSEFFAIAAVG